MRIRLLKETEIGTVSKIVGLNYPKKYERHSKREIEAMFKNYADNPTYLVAEQDSEIVGFAGYAQSWMDWHIYEIFWVNVSPQYQNKGIGTELVRKAMQNIRNKRGKDEANLILLTTTSPEFYRKLGFETLTERKKNNYLMFLRLR